MSVNFFRERKTKLGEKRVLRRIMALTTDISDMDHAMLLINWHLNKSKK
jgi:hypothetical protein